MSVQESTNINFNSLLNAKVSKFRIQEEKPTRFYMFCADFFWGGARENTIFCLFHRQLFFYFDKYTHFHPKQR